MRMKRFFPMLLEVIFSFPVQAADVLNVKPMTPDFVE